MMTFFASVFALASSDLGQPPDSLNAGVGLCDAKSPVQAWDWHNGNLVLRGTNNNYCLDIINYQSAPTSPLQGYTCHPSDTAPAHQNQDFSWNASSKEIVVGGEAAGMVVDLSNYGAEGPGSVVWIFTKAGTSNQQWNYDASTGLIKSMQTAYPKDLCLLVQPVQPLMSSPCTDPTQNFIKMLFCDATAAIDDRVDDAVGRMTLKEKIGNLDTGAVAIPSLGLAPYNWWSEASTGVASGRNTQTTKFAFPITTGMSFNRTLWQLTGRQIGREARAMMNAGNGYSTFWAPVINLAREPRWGRNIETPGEDPYHSGEYATYYVQGMEQAPEDPYHIQASACCKHYAANSMDGTTQNGVEHDRNHYDANITMQDLVDSYMLPFQACVEKGKVSGLMCSYNSINGVPSCANGWLLDTVARQEWEFDGYITSDCDADQDVVSSHHYHNDTAAEGVRDVLKAGTDVDCGGLVGGNAQAALEQKLITVDDIDARLKMLFRVRMRLGHFDPPGPLQKIDANETICSDYALALSQDGPAQSSTLLKNVGNTLPLKAGAAGGSVAVIGPNANYSQGDAGYYGPGNVCEGKFWNMVDAVAQHAGGKVVTTQGVPGATSTDTSGIPAAVAMAKTAETVVLVVGTDLSWAAEGHDAKQINFTSAQVQLMDGVIAVASNPVVIVLLTATPLDIQAYLDNPKVGAILHAGQPSVTTLGVGDVLYGLKVPAGRMVQTIYPTSYQDQISIFDFNMRPGSSPFPRPDCTKQPQSSCPNGTNPGRTYRFYNGQAVIPFGFGLSYTTFHYDVESSVSSADPISLEPVRRMLSTTKEAERIFPSTQLLEASAPLVSYTVKVTNTGTLDADDVVLGFITPPGAGTNGTPLKTLFGFERVHVPAGGTVTVNLYPSLSNFALVNEAGEWHEGVGEWKVEFGLGETTAHGQGYFETTLDTF